MLPDEGEDSSYITIGDAELIDLAREDPVAFAEIYRRHMIHVYRYLMTRTGSEGDAADLTQHVFARAFEALPRYQNRGTPVIAWLLRIARNAAHDTYRRQQRTIPWEHLPEELQPHVAVTPEGEAVRREQINQLRILVSQLDADKRELLALRFAGGLTSREIAAVVGRNEGAVKRELSRIIQRLREGHRAREE